MKMGKSVYIVTFILLGVLLSCENKKGLLPAKSAPLPVNACDSIKYMNGVKAIIDNACISCHSGPFGSGGVDLTTYTNVKARATDGRLRDRITNSSNPMPPFGLMSSSKVDSVLCWIDKGGPL
ncbi:MAG: hypothetical protein KA163_00620 [Bacteroidia bacterium]|nr:hypothetical protein [Bacteroidia bacterium]